MDGDSRFMQGHALACPKGEFNAQSSGPWKGKRAAGRSDRNCNDPLFQDAPNWAATNSDVNWDGGVETPVPAARAAGS